MIVLLAASSPRICGVRRIWSRQPATHYDPDDAQVQAIAEAVALIPDDAVVAAAPASPRISRIGTRSTTIPTPFYANYCGDDSFDGQRLPVADRGGVRARTAGSTVATVGRQRLR